MITGELKWYTVATTLEAAVYGALTDSPDRHGVVPGAIAWDACDCGMLAVSIAQVYPSENFPAPQAAKVGACDAPYEVGEVVVQVIRCAPNAEGQSLYPTTAALDASARQVARDAHEALRAVSVRLCEMNDARDISDFLVRPQVIQGPQGGCVGSELRALVSLMRN
ncbi:hypothetical protein [Streptomyces dubilierae]|uniref:Uncharacterized protein n=1 Tax=Streptomyces dubilierae TaxID=3075533 RepID=A0ABU2P7M9_9ACTN|nr:hypothetical protein [Streptomyces sp. DSM 41921]MDT0387813.1 hypothetical protein [Streptomyces sp. DSM 41921]